MNKILYVNDEGIGNVVLCLPAIEALREAGHDVAACGKYPALDLVPADIRAFTLDQLETQDEFDIVLLSPWAASYKAKYGVKGHRGAPEIFEADPIDGTKHEAMINFDLAATTGLIQMPKDLSEIKLPEIPTRETKYPSDPYVIFANTAAPLWERKRWQDYPALAKLLTEKYKVIVLGGDNDRDYFDPSEYPGDTIGIFDLPLLESAYLLKHAEWVIGNDCGLVHVASAMNVDTIALFGPTSIKKNAPLGNFGFDAKTAIMRTQMACSPCQYSAWESICTEFQCMESIKAADVERVIHNGVSLGKSPTGRNIPLKQVNILPLGAGVKRMLAVVIRVKDAIDTIQECMESAARICDLFIICDNGSTDGTLEYLQDYQKQNPDMFTTFKYTDIGYQTDFVPHDEFQMAQTTGFDEGRDRSVLNAMLNKSEATWGMILDADEIVSEQITRLQVEDWMKSTNNNLIKFRHVHFWDDKKHYRIDQRWKPRHNRMMWRITPESTIESDVKNHSPLVQNVKGKELLTDFVIKHYGHIDKAKNIERAEFYRSIDNPRMIDWTGRTYNHMTDDSKVILANWQEDTPIAEREFGNPSVLLVILHAGGDMLMVTPTIAKLKADNPNLEISILGLGKTEEKDFNTRQFFENNPNVHKYYDSQLAYHPTYWDHTAFNQKDLLLIQKDFQDLREQESTSFDSIVVVTLQSDYDKHRIDRFAWACQTSLDYNEKEMRIYPTDDEVLQATRVFENTKYEISQSHNQDEQVPIISVHRMCGNSPKSWDYSEYKQLCEFLTAQGFGLILWDMGDKEEPVTGENILNMRDQEDLTIGFSASLISYCDLHIGPDSLPMHLASAMNTATISIFERTLPSTAAPINPRPRNLPNVIATSEYAMRASNSEFRNTNVGKIVRCGLDHVKAEHLYPILEKMGLISDGDYQRIKTGTCKIFDYEIEFPEADSNIYDPPHFRESKLIDAMHHYIMPGESIFLDIGANAGLYSILMGDLIKKGVAIEPSEDVYRMLCKNLSQINMKRGDDSLGTREEYENNLLFETHNCALSNIGGIKHLNWATRGTAISFISDKAEFLSEPVTVTLLDTFGHIYKPDIIKIDVEGEELEVLQGGEETLKTTDVVAVELHGVNDDAVVEFLQARDFKIKFINQNHILATAEKLVVVPFPVNCLFDPCEYMTADLDEPSKIVNAQRTVTSMPEFLDSSYWFEYFVWVKHFGKYPGPVFSVKQYCYNKIGFKSDGIDEFLFELSAAGADLKGVHLNFLFSETGEPMRLKGEMVYPLNAETLEAFIGKCGELGFYLSGKRDYENVDIKDTNYLPDPATPVTRGRMLLSTDIPF